jgi:hypothetical protein
MTLGIHVLLVKQIFSLAYQHARLSSNVSQCAALNAIMNREKPLEEVTYVDKWKHIGK